MNADRLMMALIFIAFGALIGWGAHLFICPRHADIATEEPK